MTPSPDLTVTAIKMLITLMAILFGIVSLYYLFKKVTGNSFRRKSGGYIDIIENKYIGVKKSLCLVKVPGSILVLGLSGDRITYITEIHNEKEFQKTKDDKTKTPVSVENNFMQKLSQFLPNNQSRPNS